jgi:uncharacterized NAD(P)/FAD-binding protein YdhS
MRIANPDVAIVGAGFTGVALLVRLLWTLPDRANVLIIGTPHATGRGYAYGTELADHLLNVRAGRMSAISDEPAHFVSWLRRHGHREEGIEESYQSRALYGTYLRDTLYRSIAAQSGRLRVEVHEASVIDLQRERDGFGIQLGSGERAHARAVVLATGNGRGDFPFAAKPAGEALDLMIRDPFHDYRMGTIASDARVLLVGTGLTMIDQLLRLDSSGHRGEVVAISRHGLLPGAHPTRQRTERPPALIPGASVVDLMRLLVADGRAALREGGDWQSVVDGLRPHVQRLWQGLSRADRDRFFRHAAALWSVHRHRMAPAIAERVAAMRAEGRLTVRAGRVVGVRKTRNAVTVAFKARRSAAVELLPFDWIVNCSGIRARSVHNDPLIAALIGRRLARPAEFIGGIDVTTESQVLDGNGRPVPGLFAAGPLTVGVFFEITAVPEIRVQAAGIARALNDFLIHAAGAARSARA